MDVDKLESHIMNEFGMTRYSPDLNDLVEDVIEIAQRHRGNFFAKVQNHTGFEADIELIDQNKFNKLLINHLNEELNFARNQLDQKNVLIHLSYLRLEKLMARP